MHIEFKLPSGAGGHAAGHANSALRKRITQWAENHGNPQYSMRTGMYKLILEFEQPRYYTLFTLSWDDTSYWSKFTLVQ